MNQTIDKLVSNVIVDIDIEIETDEGENEVRMELDSHADSPVLGVHTNIIAYTGHHVTVSGFVDSLGQKKRVPIVDATIAYDCDITGQTYLLYMCNALYMHPRDEVSLDTSICYATCWSYC